MNFLKEKKELALDAPETTLLHREIVMRKGFLKKLYEEWYQTFIAAYSSDRQGKYVEIGSGGGFLKALIPPLITSDVLALPHCDMQFAAEKMPFAANSLSGIFMLDVLHHIPNSKDFFAEALRVLKPKGVIIMVEPANTRFSRFIFRNFHHEAFEPQVKEWHFPEGSPLSTANGALPWIIFERDRAIFEREFPKLKIVEIELHTPFRYLLTGGLTYKSLLPAWSFQFVSFLENLLRPFFRQLALFQTVTLKKMD